VARRKKENNSTKPNSRPDSVAASLVEKNWYIDFKVGTNSEKRKERQPQMRSNNMIINILYHFIL